MNPALWISKTGLSAQDQKLAAISNNLANASTNAFKKDRIVFQDLLYQIKRQPGGLSSQDTTLPSGLQQGTGVRTAASQKMFTQGNLQVTQEQLDVAINGRGFFSVLQPDGSIGYTRDGQFQIDATGQIVTSSGSVIQPAVTLPNDATSVTIGTDGTVSVVNGEGAQTQIGQIQVSDFINPSGLQAIGDNTFKETVASGTATSGTPGLNGIGKVIQGSLESSNVQVVEELVSLISTQRSYEMNSKVISAADSMLQFITQQL